MSPYYAVMNSTERKLSPGEELEIPTPWSTVPEKIQEFMRPASSPKIQILNDSEAIVYTNKEGQGVYVSKSVEEGQLVKPKRFVGTVFLDRESVTTTPLNKTGVFWKER